ncbi:MAG: crotonase/enoyl-CoA hydratase family protein [Acidimicrobiia bacterium]
MGYEHLEIESDGPVATLWLNRPEKLNALSADIWADLPRAVAALDSDDSVRVIVLAGRGTAFTVGIDVNLLAGLRPEGPSEATRNLRLYQSIRRLQGTISSLADASKPVIAAVHGYCLGAGVNLISACDLRIASSDAVFSIRETRMGLVADIGALQRLPKIVGHATTTEMALTGDDYEAGWALGRGLVSSVADDRDQLMSAVYDLARGIAANSPLVTTGIKRVLKANDGHTIEEGLEFAAQWNSSFLLSNDLTEAIGAFMEKRPPDFKGE